MTIPLPPPRLLVVSQAYPPRPYGVSVLVYRQVSELARLYREALGLAPGAPVPLCVVAPQFTGDAAPMPPIEGVEEIRFPASRTPIWRVPSMAIHVWRAWRAFRPEVVYCPQYRALGPVVMGLSALTGVPYATYWHGTEILTELPSAPRRMLLRAYARRASAHMANSAYTCDLATRKLGPFGMPVAEVNPHVDPVPFDLARAQRPALRERWQAGAEPTAGGRRVLLTACSLTYRKAVDVVLDALLLLREREPGAVARLDWWIAGAGTEGDKLRATLRAAGIAVAEGDEPFPDSAPEGFRVRFLGVVKHAQLPAAFSAADLFALTSRDVPDNVESFGIVYLEAAAARMPVIATNVGGVPSAVEEGVSGLLVPPGDPEPVAAALLRVLQDDELAERLGRRGRERLDRGFTPAVAGNKLFEQLSRIAKR